MVSMNYRVGAEGFAYFAGTQVAATLDLLSPASGTGVDAHYRAAYPEADPGQLKEIINADWLFRMPSHHLAAAQHAGGGTAWLYELCWSFNPDEGASHSLDVLLVFGTLSVADIRRHHCAYPSATTKVDGISRTMRADWVNFASGGDPVGRRNPRRKVHPRLRRRRGRPALPGGTVAPHLVAPPV